MAEYRFIHKDGRIERLTDRDLRDRELGIGLRLIHEYERDGLAESDRHGLFCTCTNKPIKMTIFRRKLKGRRDLYAICLRTHKASEAIRHDIECPNFRDLDGSPLNSAIKKDELTGEDIYKIRLTSEKEDKETPDKRYERITNAGSYDARRATIDTSDAIKRIIKVYHREKQQKGAVELTQQAVYGRIMATKTEVKGKTVSLSEAISRRSQKMIFGRLVNIVKKENRTPYIIVRTARTSTECIYLTDDKLKALEGSFMEHYGAVLQEAYKDCSIMSCCLVPKVEPNPKKPWLTNNPQGLGLFPVAPSGLPVDDVAEAGYFAILSDAISAHEGIYYYAPVSAVPGIYKGFDNYIPDALIVSRKTGTIIGVVDFFVRGSIRHEKIKADKISSAAVPMAYIDKKAPDVEKFREAVGMICRAAESQG